MHLRSARALAVALSLAATFSLPSPTSFAAAPQSAAAPAAPDALPAHGSYRLHKFMQPIGTETYDVTRDGEAIVLAAKFEFSDRGTKVPLEATLRARPDLTPLHFEIKGNTSRSSTIDTVVDVTASGATVTEAGTSRTEAVGGAVFASGGYAPVSMQMAMVRYWLSHGRPAVLHALPVGDVTITDRGPDTVQAGGASVTLTRYCVDGLKWGREWLWLDADRNLAGLVTTDAEFDHFEAVPEAFESALPELVSRAAADGMAQLADTAKRLSPPTRGPVAIVGATLVDATGAAPVADSAVVLEGDRIVAAGPRSKVKIPRGATIVDGKGRWLVPGLWDMHAHFEQVEWGPLYLAAGVTTARDCGNVFEFIKGARDAIEAGKGLGPRLLLAGIVDGDSPMALGVVRINTAEEAHAVVARYKAAGFDQIKIYSSIKPEMVPVITAEAHKAGMTVTGHVPNTMNILQAVEGGMDQINHLQYVAALAMPLSKIRTAKSPAEAVEAIRASRFDTPEMVKAIDELKAHHTVIDPTIALFQWIWHPANVPFATIEPGAAKLPSELAGPINGAGVSGPQAEVFGAVFDKWVELVGVLHKAGITIVAGTDQAIPGYSLHREIELYQRAGFTPLEALQSATIVPSRAMGKDKEVGTIEVGKRADLLLVDADPLADVANLRKIRFVVARGRVYEPAPLWRAVDFQP